MEPIVPRSVVLEKARGAVKAGHALEAALPWPIGSAAGQLFQQEFMSEKAIRASRDFSGHRASILIDAANDFGVSLCEEKGA